ncbi:MAG TPA: sugar ABC transporter ATP-binding protein [Pseudolysinimonas sp.]|nr:sugar ABC transporter ATP-binding protein [Pseudolysinimonas sp.]
MLEYRSIEKRYGGAVALAGVSLTLEPARIHAFVGENGAGKSTLSKIAAGAEQPDGGEVLINGEAMRFRSPREALDSGVAMVHQEISLVPTLSVFDNIFLGSRGTQKLPELRARFRRLLDDCGSDLDGHLRVDTLPLADQQMVEIMRAMAYDARIIILDEPTAPLTLLECEHLYATLRRLRDGGTTIVFVSHYLDEVLELADTVSIFKDGKHVRSSPAAAETADTLISGMLGREISSVYPDKRKAGASEPVLVVDDFAGGVVKGASLEFRPGEIVSVFGLIGSGRSELARLIVGRDRRTRGSLHLEGEERKFRSPADAIKAGVAYLSEDRKDEGLFALRSVRENLTIAALPYLNPFGLIHSKKEKSFTYDIAEQLELRPLDTEKASGDYSGGNQQKIVFGRCLVRTPKVLIADEPTRGVDVGARLAMYQLLDNLARSGVAVIVISSDIDEVRGLGDRILVMRHGQICCELPADAPEDSIVSAAFGTSPEGLTS